MNLIADEGGSPPFIIPPKKSEGWSIEQKEAIRATLTFLCQEAYEAGHSARQKDRVVTGSDVDRRIETVLSEIEAITKGEQ